MTEDTVTLTMTSKVRLFDQIALSTPEGERYFAVDPAPISRIDKLRSGAVIEVELDPKNNSFIKRVVKVVSEPEPAPKPEETPKKEESAPAPPPSTTRPQEPAKENPPKVQNETETKELKLHIPEFWAVMKIVVKCPKCGQEYPFEGEEKTKPVMNSDTMECTCGFRGILV